MSPPHDDVVKVRRAPPWWLVAALLPTLVVLAVCIRDATAWIGRPFPGFLFSDSRIVFSIGRAAWRVPSSRPLEWAQVTAVNGTTIASASSIQATAAATGIGGAVTYTLRRGTEVFRVAIPVREFTSADFAEVFAPMLAAGAWTIAVAAAAAALRPDLAAVRALFAMCLSLALVLITGPDEYGPYRFTWLFFLALAVMPPAVLHLAAAFLWHPARWGRRIIAALYVVFALLGAVLVSHREDPSVFLPLLYIVYCALANAILLYAGSLVSALVSGQRFRPQVLLALGAIVGSGATTIAVLVTYPLRTEPVSAPWFIVPLGLWPLLHAIAFVRLERRAHERALAAADRGAAPGVVS